jgi:diguanylate cyclase (GGDEF)-like protein
MKSFSIAARINLFLMVVVFFIVGFSFYSNKSLSKDILYAMNVESLLQRKNVKLEVLNLEQLQALELPKSQLQSFLENDEMIDLGLFKENQADGRLYWIEKTDTPNYFNVRSASNSYSDYLVRLALDYSIYLGILLVILIPIVFALSIVLMRPMASLRKISEDVLAGNYDVGKVSYNAKDDLGRTLVALKTLSDDLKKNQKELEKVSELAIRDALTGLKNHRAFKQAIHRELAMVRRHDRELGIVMLDVDKFKKFNDTYGHQQGDEVLKVVGATLEETARTSDFVARYGGEEFVLLFPETGKEGIMQACEKFRQAIEAMKVRNINKEGEFLSVTASFGGVCVRSNDVVTLEGDDFYKMYVEVCDQNLYKAKDKGRNCSVVSGMDGKV